MKESAKAKKLRIKNALAALQTAYPDARPQLDFTNPFELLWLQCSQPSARISG